MSKDRYHSVECKSVAKIVRPLGVTMTKAELLELIA